MKSWIAVCILWLSAWGGELEHEYTFTDTTIRSKDLIAHPGNPFEILKIPTDKSTYRVDARLIAKSFELHGIAIDISKTPYITFQKKSPVDFTPLGTQLADLLRARYPSITIERITVSPRGYLPSLPADTKAVFDTRTHLSPTGTFYILDGQGLRHYLDYSVDATLRVFHTARAVSRKETADGSTLTPQAVPFVAFKDTPITRFPDRTHRFRSALKEGVLLTERNIEEMPLVLKDDRVVVAVQSDGLTVEYFGVAVQEGALYDIITIQKRDGKRAKAKVIGEKRVELQ